jgi:hypothetical protein
MCLGTSHVSRRSAHYLYVVVSGVQGLYTHMLKYGIYHGTTVHFVLLCMNI